MLEHNGARIELKPQLVHSTASTIKQAANLLRCGKIVAFPTETVYGLGADATSDIAVETLFRAKQRPYCNPFIIHLADVKDIESVAYMDELAQYLAEMVLPGPLTLVLWQHENSRVSVKATVGQKTIAVRVPQHPTTRTLLKQVNTPIAAASANISGGVSTTTPYHIMNKLSGRVDFVLAEGRSRLGIESTILDLTTKKPLILRQGAITQEYLETLIGPIGTSSPADANQKIKKAPGQFKTHYAPSIPVRLNATHLTEGEALLAFGPDTFIRGGTTRLNLSPTGDLEQAANNLYNMLHTLDRPEHKAIAVMKIPKQGLGIALNDRLCRASGLKS